MAILFPSPGSGWLLTLKVLLASASVLLVAVLMKTSVPVIAEFVVSEIPAVYAFVLSWLRPPYLYVLINCIIISIVASSKLQHHGAEEAPPPGSPAVKASGDARIEYASYDIAYDEGLMNTVSDPEYELGGAEDAEVKEVTTDGQVLRPVKLPEIINDRTDISFLTTTEDENTKKKKPPVSGKFPPRRQTKSSPEAGKALGVSKPKRHDTLESTWKAITDGRPMPLARHLRKSDTWGDRLRRNDENIPPPPPAKMKKSETFTTTDHSGSNPPPSLIRSPGGSGKIKREPSLGQDELNRRVEAFIKKFNEEMRLQRQESLNQQYQEMIRQAAT